MYFCRKENGFKSAHNLDVLLQVFVTKYTIEAYKANMFLQYSDLMNLPDDLNNIIDELKDARYDNSETNCEEIFSDCPAPSIVSIKKNLNKLMK